MIDLINLLICLAVIITIFLVCREIVCWYWKLNRIVEVLEDIRTEIKKGNIFLDQWDSEGLRVDVKWPKP